jgi:glycosyltransferase involved in cell wall biosynthesis
MKILFGIPIKVHREIAEAEVKAFQEMGVEVETSSYGNSGEVKGMVKSFLLILKNAINLKRKLTKHKSDIIYLNTAFDAKTLVRDSISIFILQFLKKKVRIVLKTHGTIESVVLSDSILRNYIFKKADLILVLSKEELNNFFKAGLVTNKVQITANPIDPRNYFPDSTFKKSRGLNEETSILLYVGRFIKEKGILDLIEATNLLKQNHLEFKLICLGDGPLFSEIGQLITKFNLQNEVCLLGHIPEVETNYYYSNCDILILPSYREGFPMAIFQAVAAGKSIITTKINACADYFVEYQNCFWVEKNNPVDLSKKITTLAKDKNLRDIMRINNLSLSKKFTSKRIVADLHAYMENLLKINITHGRGNRAHRFSK